MNDEITTGILKEYCDRFHALTELETRGCRTYEMALLEPTQRALLEWKGSNEDITDFLTSLIDEWERVVPASRASEPTGKLDLRIAELEVLSLVAQTMNDTQFHRTVRGALLNVLRVRAKNPAVLKRLPWKTKFATHLILYLQNELAHNDSPSTKSPLQSFLCGRILRHSSELDGEMRNAFWNDDADVEDDPRIIRSLSRHCQYPGGLGSDLDYSVVITHCSAVGFLAKEALDVLHQQNACGSDNLVAYSLGMLSVHGRLIEALSAALTSVREGTPRAGRHALANRMLTVKTVMKSLTQAVDAFEIYAIASKKDDAQALRSAMSSLVAPLQFLAGLNIQSSCSI